MTDNDRLRGDLYAAVARRLASSGVACTVHPHLFAQCGTLGSLAIDGGSGPRFAIVTMAFPGHAPNEFVLRRPDRELDLLTMTGGDTRSIEATAEDIADTFLRKCGRRTR
jgi:hypothetical protein